jgi:hypothetical protein
MKDTEKYFEIPIISNNKNKFTQRLLAQPKNEIDITSPH